MYALSLTRINVVVGCIGILWKIILEEISKLFDKFSDTIFAKIVELWEILSGDTNFSFRISQIFHRTFLKCAEKFVT